MPFLGKTPSQIVDPEVDIDGGTIDGVSIGSVTANAGAFTNLTATGTLTLPDDGISGDDINGGTISNFASTGIDDNATSTVLTVTDSGIAATLTTAAQPNITSVGTLTGFTSTGIDDNATSTAITIDSSENVGIGTISPASTSAAASSLTVKNVSSFYGYDSGTLAVTGVGTNIQNIGGTPQFKDSGRYVLTYTQNDNDASHVWDSSSSTGTAGATATMIERMRLDASGNLGVGTSGTLSAKLHVTGLTNGRALKLQNVGAASAAYAVFVSDDGTEDAYIGNEPSQIAQDTMVFGTGGTERMRINGSGNVGIENTSPSCLLQVGKQTSLGAVTNKTVIANFGGYYSSTSAFQYQVLGFTGTIPDTSDISLQTGSESSKNFYMGLFTDYGYFNNNRFSIYNNGGERLTIQKSTGNVGIGAPNPSTKLHLADNASNAPTLLRIDHTESGGLQAPTVLATRVTDANGARAGFGHNLYPSADYSFNASRLNSSVGGWCWSSYVLGSAYQDQNAMTLQYVNAAGTQSERLRVDANGQLTQPSNNFVARSYSLNAGSSYTISVPAKYGIWELVIYGAAVNYSTGAYGTRYQVYHVGSLDGYPYTAWAPTTNTVTDITRVQTGPAPGISISAGVNGAIAVTLSGTGTLLSGWSLRLMGFGPAY